MKILDRSHGRRQEQEKEKHPIAEIERVDEPELHETVFAQTPYLPSRGLDPATRSGERTLAHATAVSHGFTGCPVLQMQSDDSATDNLGMRGLLRLYAGAAMIVALAAATYGIWLLLTVDREFRPRGTVGIFSLVLASVLAGVALVSWRRSR